MLTKFMSAFNYVASVIWVRSLFSEIVFLDVNVLHHAMTCLSTLHLISYFLCFIVFFNTRKILCIDIIFDMY